MTSHYVYILAGEDYGPIYIESVRDIVSRIRDHKLGRLSHEKFRIDRLVYIEKHKTKTAALRRENALKKASRQWLDALIERRNPDWTDLAVMKSAPQQIAA